MQNELMSLKEFILNYGVTRISSEAIFFTPNIPNDKLSNAIKSYGKIGNHKLNQNDVIILIDNTFWGSSKEGVLITEQFLLIKGSSHFVFKINELKDSSSEHNVIYLNGKNTEKLSKPNEMDLGYVFSVINEYVKIINKNPKRVADFIDYEILNDICLKFNTPDCYSLEELKKDGVHQSFAERKPNKTPSYYVGEDIPEILEKMARFCLSISANEKIVALSDLSINQGNATSAFVVSTGGIYSKKDSEDVLYLSWKQIKNLSVVSQYKESRFWTVNLSDKYKVTTSNQNVITKPFGYKLLSEIINLVSSLDITGASAILDNPDWKWDNDNIYAYPNIPEKKLIAAINSYANEVSPSDVLVLLDDTFFGGSQEGVLITNDAMYVKEKSKRPKRIFFNEISSIQPGSNSSIMVDGEIFFHANFIDHFTVGPFASRLSSVLDLKSKKKDKQHSNEKELKTQEKNISLSHVSSEYLKTTSDSKLKTTIDTHEENTSDEYLTADDKVINKQDFDSKKSSYSDVTSKNKNGNPMKNINSFLKENISSVSPSNITVAPMIPENKLNNAIKSFGYTKDFNNIVALYDNTLFGSGKDGIVFTGELLIYRQSFSDPRLINYSDIQSVNYINNVSFDEKGKQKKEEFVELNLKNSGKIKIDDLSDCDYKKLSEILTDITSNFEEFKEEDQLLTLSEMSEQLKIAYVKVVINMAYSDDGKVDEKEFAEILMLMTRLDLSSESRFELRVYMTNETELTSLKELLNVIATESPESQYKSVKISLVKDLISIYMSLNGRDCSINDFDFFNANKALFGVSDGEIEFILMAIKTDFQMLRDDYSDNDLENGMKELAAKSAAVGVPLAAVYLSGSIIGLSATGITSGLAAIGFGGILGLSSMATGIGVAVLLGIGAYKGVRHITGVNELDKSQRRELMLNEVIKQTQSTLSLLIEDINYITGKLNHALLSIGTQEVQIKKLASMMSTLTGAATVLNKQNEHTQNSAMKLRCPKYLDVNKLHSLTNEPVKKPVYDFIIKFYNEETYTEEKNGEVLESTRYKIMDKIANKDVESLAKAFETIGYFKVAEALKGTVNDVTNKAKEKLTGFFSSEK